MSLRERRLVPQLKLGARIGAVKELAGQAQMYWGLVNTAMIAGLFYEKEWVQALVPSPVVWYGALVAFFGGVVVFHYSVVHKGWVEFNQQQAADVDVNPHYRRMVEEHEQQMTLLQTFIEQQRRIECQSCERPAVEATHKGVDVLQCPDCEEILFREVA